MLTINFDQLGLSRGEAILDLGCGEGRHSIGLANARKDIIVVGVDMCSRSLTTAAKRLEHTLGGNSAHCQFVQADGSRLPFAAHSFDHIICSEVLEHIVHYQDFLSEITRLLKPGGTLAVSVPRAWPERICWWLSKDYHQVEGGHVRIFSAKALRRDIERQRFRYMDGHGAHALHVPYWWLRCLFWQRGESFFLTRWYHKLLVWDLFKRPLLTRVLDALLNPVMGKSVAMYFNKHHD